MYKATVIIRESWMDFGVRISINDVVVMDEHYPKGVNVSDGELSLRVLREVDHYLHSNACTRVDVYGVDEDIGMLFINKRF